MTFSPKKQFTNHGTFADSSEEADKRFRLAFDTDPFPNIPCSLLNSADIADYVRLTGMLYPFNSRLIKSASCEVEIGDKCIYWDEKGKLHDLDLKDGDNVDLNPNSIMFVNTKQEFRLPQYIALRFNLRINHVHQGVLLGTGPLVDPGFEGRLLIPLHNLTVNKYTLRSGDPIAWVDFTKISPHKWTNEYGPIKNADNLTGTYENFPDEKKNLTPWNYLTNAHKIKAPEGGLKELIKNLIVQPYRGSIRSSIPEALEGAKKEMRRLRNFAIAGAVTAVISVVGIGIALVVSGTDIITQLNTRIQTTSEFAANALAEVSELRGEIKNEIRTEIKDEIFSELAMALDALKKEQIKIENDSRAETIATTERISELTSQIEILTEKILLIESKPEPPAN